jgi:hypothetical protein
MRRVIALVALMYALSASLYGQAGSNPGHQPNAQKPATATSKKPASTPKKTPATSASTTTVKTSTPASTTQPTTSTTPTTQYMKNPTLEARLLKMLPEGTNLNRAAAGFRNWGQFVATLHVSDNLNIPFRDLKTRMVSGQMSLGQAIQDWKGSQSTTPIITPRPASTEREVRKAEQQAADDFRRSRDEQR